MVLAFGSEHFEMGEDLKFTTAEQYMNDYYRSIKEDKRKFPEIDFEDMYGKYELDAVDMDYLQMLDDAYYAPSHVIKFRLNGIVYLACENPEDGYRSSMDFFTIMKDNTMKNVFPPVEVVAVSGADETDTLVLIDTTTGKQVLEVGTNYSDGYYPYFVSYFDPTAMSINQNQEK